jgi:hypothetical protein
MSARPSRPQPVADPALGDNSRLRHSSDDGTKGSASEGASLSRGTAVVSSVGPVGRSGNER